MRWFLLYHCWDAAGNTLACGGCIFYHFPTDDECDLAIADVVASNPIRATKIHARIEKE
jgi:hypothetical protein